LASDIVKKLDLSDCSLAHVSVIRLLHYLVRCRSLILAVCNNEFILSSARIGSEMIHRIASNMSNSYYLSESLMCYITSLLLLLVLKMSSFSTNASGWTLSYSPTASSVMCDPLQLVDIRS